MSDHSPDPKIPDLEDEEDFHSHSDHSVALGHSSTTESYEVLDSVSGVVGSPENTVALHEGPPHGPKAQQVMSPNTPEENDTIGEDALSASKSGVIKIAPKMQRRLSASNGSRSKSVDHHASKVIDRRNKDDIIIDLTATRAQLKTQTDTLSCLVGGQAGQLPEISCLS